MYPVPSAVEFRFGLGFGKRQASKFLILFNVFFLFVFLILLFSFFVEFRFLQLFWTRVSVCFFKKVFLYFIIKYLLTLWFDFFLGSFWLQTREIWLVFFI